MSAQALIAQLRSLRSSWCILREADGDSPELAVCLRRPPEVELAELRPRDGKSPYAALAVAICNAAVDWRGFTEAELLGAAVGSSDALAFDAALWAEVIRDRGGWLDACIAHLMTEVNKHREQREAEAKN